MSDRTRFSDEGKDHVRHDPAETELEIDAANDCMGGPGTGSLDNGLSSTLRDADDEGDDGSAEREDG